VRMNTCFASVDLTKASLSTQIPMATVKKTVRVAAAQMTSVNDMMANFNTCSRLVQEAASAGFQERFDDTHLYNTHVVIDDTGMIQSTYQKMHLFDVDVPGGSSYEESSFTVPGKNIVSVDSPVGRLGLTVCYDLRFPKIYQQLRFDQKAQVILVPSAFTTVTGDAHWEILLRSRAIETQCYVIAASQAGKHNEKRESYGDTLIIDPWGSVVGRLPDRFSTGITVADIDFSLLESVRTKMPIDKQRVSIDL
ncbi:hypothetical protein HID58_087090, partial [Brassica napus]